MHSHKGQLCIYALMILSLCLFCVFAIHVSAQKNISEPYLETQYGGQNVRTDAWYDEQTERHYFFMPYAINQANGFRLRLPQNAELLLGTQRLRNGDRMPAFVSTVEGVLRYSTMNNLRWQELGVPLEEEDLLEELEKIYNFLAARTEFLDRVWVRQEPYCAVRIKLPDLDLDLCIQPGETLFDQLSKNAPVLKDQSFFSGCALHNPVQCACACHRRYGSLFQANPVKPARSAG